ncbi:unnamed protein product [Chironomus riparius]|uniref:DDB1- and CUL4-associated factor 13 n=1 Tax=Chironomus riparius TaxID=315576 RepID=A0A9N9RW36_9DIPT|nr:unnamed protein product [Chironomus riparius]
MKVKVLSRNPDDYIRDTKTEFHKVTRNYSKEVHPFEEQREYVRALNATKIERMFAKPLIGDLSGHKDGISCIAKHPTQLSTLVTGSFDGDVCVWNLPTRKCMKSLNAHDGFVRGIVFSTDGDRFLSVGDDKAIKVWTTNTYDMDDEEDDNAPINTILSKTVLTSITHHRRDPIFATCGEMCQLWEESRNEPLKSLQWGSDSIHHIQFNLVENNLLAACTSSRSIILYDRREGKPLRKVVMSMRPNYLAWNPMEAFTFTVANEDYNSYTFDTRNLNLPRKIHENHVAAVTCVDYAPTGKEFVSGSYDKTIRIYDVEKTNSREIYHTKRQQHITAVAWSSDNKYIYSGSDEMNIRIWKANASEKLGPVSSMIYNYYFIHVLITYPFYIHHNS